MTMRARIPGGRLAAIALFVLALAFRLVGLGRFAFPDEARWIQRSVAFLTAVHQGNWSGTFQNAHPGVVPMWGFGVLLWLRQAVVGQGSSFYELVGHANPPDMPALLATAAVFTAVVTALSAVAVWWLLCLVMDRRLAFLGAVLVAIDPFYLSHSRIVHVDGVLTALMTTSALALVVHLHREQRRWLFLSGGLAGFALLTKSPALVLLPLCVFALALREVVRWRQGRPMRPVRTLLDLVLWLLTVLGVFILVWPAAWVDPVGMMWRVLRGSRWGVVTSHGFNYFLGQNIPTPGPLYYLVVVPLRLTPVALVGALLAIPVLAGYLLRLWRPARQGGRDNRQSGDPGQHTAGEEFLVVVGWAFVIGFLVAISVSAKKGDRYSVPIFPMLDVLAVIGWGVVLRWLLRRRGREPGDGHYVVAGIALLLLAVLWLRLAPYYGAYFNPLLGGGRMATWAFPFGQGEGLDLAASYLNRLPQSESLDVVSFYPTEFGYYFRGRAHSLRRKGWDGTWRFADYVVFYVSQVQRELPTAELVHFFRETQKPVYTARLGNVDFAWVYRSPALLSGRSPVRSGELDQSLDERLVLVGFDLGQDKLVPGQTAELSLRWRVLRPVQANYVFRLRLVDAAGTFWVSEVGQPYDGHWPTGLWVPGKVMRTRYRVSLPRNLAGGRYCWRIELIPRPDWQNEPPFRADVVCQDELGSR
jgi:hypothetical protein